MNCKTNKEKGNAGLGMAIAYFATNGYTISIPLNDTQDYDLIVEKENKFQSVQVKSTGFKSKYGVYQVNLRNFGGTKGTEYKTVINTSVDFLFVVTMEKDLYLIPVKEISNKNSINLSDKYLKYKLERI